MVLIGLPYFVCLSSVNIVFIVPEQLLSHNISNIGYHSVHDLTFF